MGDLQYGASYSYAETVDLVSDGPIEGLVNQNGIVVGKGLKMLQGIYLDDTPVAVTDGLEASTSRTAVSESEENQLNSQPIPIASNGATSCKNFFTNLQDALDFYNPDGTVTSLKYNNNEQSAWDTEFKAAPSVNMVYYRQKTRNRGGRNTTPSTVKRDIAFYARAYICLLYTSPSPRD